MIQSEDSQCIHQSPHSAVSVQLYSSFFLFLAFLGRIDKKKQEMENRGRPLPQGLYPFDNEASRAQSSSSWYHLF